MSDDQMKYFECPSGNKIPIEGPDKATPSNDCTGENRLKIDEQGMLYLCCDVRISGCPDMREVEGHNRRLWLCVRGWQSGIEGGE